MKNSLRFALTAPVGLAMAILFIASCYPSGYYIPPPPPPPFAPEPNVQTSEDGVRITVIPSYWTGSPGNLQNYVTPFYITIENFSGRPLGFDYSDIVLFDQLRTQYSPLNPQAVADIVESSGPVYAYPSYPNVSVGIGGGYYGGYYRGGWGPYYGPYWRPFGFYAFNPIWYYPPPAYYYAKPPGAKDVITEALAPGSVAPNASVRGYIFFKQMPDQVNQVTLDISYEIEGTPVYRTLSFGFPVLPRGQ